ncbi:MAG: fumarate hydrolyase [Nitrospirae bacterium]|nr:MAG: fumarate hydrolyase [Nitrospirota bacterium]
MEPKRIKTPIDEDTVRGLTVGDFVLLSGRVVTGRDRVHKYLYKKSPEQVELPLELEGLVLYHCGPIVRKLKDGFEIVSAGPTTSIRMEIYEPWVIKNYGIRGIIGKGGMGMETLKAMKEAGCVYMHTISGAAAYLAKRIKRVVDVWNEEEFGMTEALWVLEVEEFPVIITMDAKGNSLHDSVLKQTEQQYRGLLNL